MLAFAEIVVSSITLITMVLNGSTWFLVAQLATQLPSVVTSTSTSAIRRALTSMSKPATRDATAEQVQAFKSAGALSARANIKGNTLISKTTVLHLLSILQAPADIVAAIRNCIPAMPRQAPAAAADDDDVGGDDGGGEGAAAASNRSSNSVVCFPAVLPNTLPDLTFTQEQLKKHYGLHSSVVGKRVLARFVRGPLSLLKKWCMSKVELSRPLQFTTALASESWDKVEKGICSFLGFCLHIMQVGQGSMSLACYLQPSLVLAFVQFGIQRKVLPTTLTFHCDVAIRVASFLMACNMGAMTRAQKELASTYATHLQSLKGQLTANVRPLVGYSIRPRDPDVLAALDKWMEADMLVECVMKAHSRACLAIAAHPPGTPVPLELAALVQGTLIGCLCFGFLPPIRPSIIMSLMAPSPLCPCPHPDCQHKHRCRGNRVTFDRAAAAAAAAAGTWQWSLCVVHHKNSRWWGPKALIECPLPYELATLTNFMVYGGGCAAIARTRAPGEHPPYLFINPSTLKPLTYTDVGLAWSENILRGSGVSFPPQFCRAVFVQERRGPDARAVPGMTDQAAAKVLGHSLDQWDRTYDRQFLSRQVGALPAALRQWRQELMARAAKRRAAAAPAPPAAPGTP